MKYNKNPFLTISQFAQICGTTRQTLQYYDKIGLMRPLYIGRQGYRYYDFMQRFDFQLISTLKQSGCTLEEIKSLMRAGGSGQMLQTLSEKRNRLELEAKRISKYRIFLDYTIGFLKFASTNVEGRPRLLEINHYVGVLRHVFKRPAEIGSLELGAELLAFNSLCASSESIQQFPYCYVIPEAELENGQKRISQILCLYHSFDADDTPELLPQGKYVMLRKNIRFRDEENRSEAYDMVGGFLRANKLSVRGECYEIPTDAPDFLRDGRHFHIIIMAPVEDARG
jgi:DNA-binding transcriptional MerR regulator